MPAPEICVVTNDTSATRHCAQAVPSQIKAPQVRHRPLRFIVAQQRDDDLSKIPHQLFLWTKRFSCDYLTILCAFF
jgi:hypothetical protein